jgi:hypothetical protein
MVKAKQQWIVVEEARLTIVRDQRDPTQELRFVPVPDCQESTLRALTGILRIWYTAEVC